MTIKKNVDAIIISSIIFHFGMVLIGWFLIIVIIFPLCAISGKISSFFRQFRNRSQGCSCSSNSSIQGVVSISIFAFLRECRRYSLNFSYPITYSIQLGFSYNLCFSLLNHNSIIHGP